MQIIRYTPQQPQAGTFDFPLIAVIRLIEAQLEAEFTEKEWLYLQQLVDLTSANREVFPVGMGWLNDLIAAALIDRGAFTVYCPCCEAHLSAKQIQAQAWSYYHSPQDAGGGQIYRCDRGHDLLTVQRWIT